MGKNNNIENWLEPDELHQLIEPRELTIPLTDYIFSVSVLMYYPLLLSTILIDFSVTTTKLPCILSGYCFNKLLILFILFAFLWFSKRKRMTPL